MIFTDQDKYDIQTSLGRISINDMPRVGRSVMFTVLDPNEVSKLALEVLAKLVVCFESAKTKDTNTAPLYDRCLRVVVRLVVQKVIQVADKTKLPKYLTQKYCEKFIELAGAEINPEDHKYLRLKHVPQGDKQTRIKIKSDILSSLVGDELPPYSTLLQIHMTDRLGLLFLMLVAVHNTPYEYSLAETQLQIGKGSKKDKTDGGHMCAVPQFQRQARGVANAPVQKGFIVQMFLYLSMNRVDRIKRDDNEVDMKMEPRMRPMVIEAMNESANGRLVTSCFERAVEKIQNLVNDIKLEWQPDPAFAGKLKGLIDQEKGIDCVVDPKTGKVDPEFYRMNSRLIDDNALQTELQKKQWTQLDPSTQLKIISSLQKQILSHSAVPYLEKRSPTLLNRLIKEL